MAMRLGPGTSEWRSVPMDRGVVRGPTTWAGCHSGGAVGAGLPCRVAGDAALGAVWCGDAEGGGEGGGDDRGGDFCLGDDFDEDFVVAGFEEGADLFPVEGSPGFVLAGDDAVDGCDVGSGADDVQAGARGGCVEMEGVAELGGGVGGDFLCVGIGEPEPADGG